MSLPEDPLFKIPFTYILDTHIRFMSDWKPHGGPRNDETKELCPDCEGTSQCLLCCMHWDSKKKEWIAPYDPNCNNCGGTFECPNCEGTGLVDV